MDEFKDFITSLKENLESYGGEYDDFINYSPKLFELLCNIFLDKEISPKIRYKISLAIAYFVVPEDKIPEKVFGPYGYIDDIFVVVYILKELIEINGIDFIKKYWKSYSDVNLVLNECEQQTEALLNPEEKKEILKFLCL